MIVLVAAPLVFGEEPQRPSEKQRAEHLARMKDVAASIRLLANPRRADSAVKLVETGLHKVDEVDRTLCYAHSGSLECLDLLSRGS